MFTKTQQQVLTLLYMHPERSFYTNEIIRSVKIGTGSVHRVLKQFIHLKLLSVSCLGNQKRYQANLSSPIFNEFRGIVLKTFGLAEILRTEIKTVETEIPLAFVYGSVAKNEDKHDSDIDLLIVSDTITYAELFPLLQKAEAKIARVIHPTLYSQEAWHKKQNSHFLKNVITLPKIFIIGSEDVLIKLGESC